MAVDGPGYTLDAFLFTPPSTRPVDYDQGVALDPGQPSGYVAPVAWSYNQFPNEAPCLWERAWYRSKASTATFATHSVLATLQSVRLTGVAQNATVVVAAARIDAGVASGPVKVIGAASGAYGKAAGATGAVSLASAKALLGTVLLAPTASEPIMLDGRADAIAATPLNSDPVRMSVDGTAQADQLAGGIATGQVALTGSGAGTRAQIASFAPQMVRLTGQAIGTLVPPLTTAPVEVTINALATVTLANQANSTGVVKLTRLKATASTGPSGSATGSIIIAAHQGETVEAVPVSLDLDGQAVGTQLHMAKASGTVLVQPLSVFARQTGDTVAVGSIMLGARIWETWEVAAPNGSIEILRGQVKAVVGIGLKSYAQITLNGSATGGLLSTAQSGGQIDLDGQAQADVQVNTEAVRAPIELTGTAIADGEPGIRASGDIELTGQASADVDQFFTGQAVVEFDATGEGEIPPPIVVEGWGYASLNLKTTGHGEVTYETEGVSNAWIILRGTGGGSRTIDSPHAPTAWITFRTYGTALPLRRIREHVAPHRSDSWLVHAEIAKPVLVTHAAVEARVVGYGVSEMPTANRVDNPVLTTGLK